MPRLTGHDMERLASEYGLVDAHTLKKRVGDVYDSEKSDNEGDATADAGNKV